MEPIFVLIGLMVVSNFTTIFLMRREGIRSLKSWKTVIVTQILLPLVMFMVIVALTNLSKY